MKETHLWLRARSHHDAFTHLQLESVLYVSRPKVSRTPRSRLRCGKRTSYCGAKACFPLSWTVYLETELGLPGWPERRSRPQPQTWRPAKASRPHKRFWRPWRRSWS